MSNVAKRGLWIWFCIYTVVSVKINGIVILYEKKLHQDKVGNGYYHFLNGGDISVGSLLDKSAADLAKSKESLS